MAEDTIEDKEIHLINKHFITSSLIHQKDTRIVIMYALTNIASKYTKRRLMEL
jgi:hypothetical protein